jgi:hypothetical protein
MTGQNDLSTTYGNYLKSNIHWCYTFLWNVSISFGKEKNDMSFERDLPLRAALFSPSSLFPWLHRIKTIIPFSITAVVSWTRWCLFHVIATQCRHFADGYKLFPQGKSLLTPILFIPCTFLPLSSKHAAVVCLLSVTKQRTWRVAFLSITL